MARDNDTQHMAHINGADVDYGYYNMATDATAATVEVPTYLSAIDGVKLGWKTNPGRADVLVCDGTITNGAVTVSCTDIAADEDFWYEFTGRM